jgi:hypothetical protein
VAVDRLSQAAGYLKQDLGLLVGADTHFLYNSAQLPRRPI